MRAIKLRAWDGQEMHYDWGIDSGLGNALWLRMFPGIKQRPGLGYDVPKKYDFYDDWIFIQYTGLKDKNGKEIYEGDALSSVSSYQKEYGYVEFKYGAFNFIITSSKTAATGERYLLSTCRELEVIGNIFENPDLLEGEAE